MSDTSLARLRTIVCDALILGAMVLIANNALASESPRPQLVVSAEWLKQHINDPDLVLLHVEEMRGQNKDGYDAGHIPGARFTSSMGPLAMSEVSGSEQTADGAESPSAERLRHRLEALGISDKSRVIVSYGNDWFSAATRVLFTLDYAGLGSRSSLLDGGTGAWTRAGGAVTKEEPPPAKTGSLSPLRIRPIVVDAATVKSRIGAPGFAIVDSRSASFYDGIDAWKTADHKQRAGHIPGALSIPFTSITNDRLMLKTSKELATLFTKAGVKPGDTVIGYCHVGEQTTAALFAARILGHPVLLYDGSFRDWSLHTDYPVDNPAEKADK